MNVLHIIPNLLKGGAQRIALDICNALHERNDINVLLVYFEGENEFEYLTKNIAIKKINIQFELSISGHHQIDISDYKSTIQSFKPDVVHSHLYKAELVSKEFTLKNTKYISHCHDNIRQLSKFDFLTLFSKQKLVEYYERIRLLKKLKSCDSHFIAISKDGNDFLLKHLPSNLKSRIVFFSNAINLNNFPSKSSLHINNKCIRLVNVGNFISKKNQQFLVEVMKVLCEKYSNIELILIGDGNTLDNVKELSDKYKLDNYIQFIGSIDDVHNQLIKSDIYVHSALYEPFGLVIIEAMSSGLPVISLNGRGNSDIIKAGENGFLVPQGSIEEFAGRITELIENPQLHHKMAKNAITESKQYGMDQYIEQLISFYN